MAAPRLLLLVALLLPRVLASTRLVKFVGDPVELNPCAGCKTCELMIGHETVLQLVGGAWIGRDRLAQRIDNSSGSTFILRDANVNDGGLYDFVCDGTTGPQSYSVKVVPLYSLRVTEGDTAVLPGHTRTAGRTVTAATWSRNGTVVCSLRPADGTRTCGPGHNHSASVAPGGNVTGDFSLTLPAVKREQGGNYTVCVEFKIEDTECGAVSLEVLTPDGSVSDTSVPKNTHTWIAVIAVLAVLAAAGWGWALWLRCRRSPGPEAAGEPPNGDIELGLLSNGKTARPHGQHDQGV